MIGANREAPGNKVVSPAGADERGPDSDCLRALVRLGVVDFGNVVLGHAAFQNMHGVQIDRGNRFVIPLGGVATLFETWGKQLSRHAPNLIQSRANVHPPLGLAGLRLAKRQSHRQLRARSTRADLDAARMGDNNVSRNRQPQPAAC